MKPAPFELLRPHSIEEALALLADRGDDAKVLAGGQSLVPMLALRLVRFDALVDITDVASLNGIECEAGTATVLAATPQRAVERSLAVSNVAPLLVRATRLIGHFQIRNRGTIGGALAHADPAGELPAAAVTLDAVLQLRSHAGTREIPAGEFFVGTWTTVLEPEELLCAVRFRSWGGRSGFSVKEVARRRGDFALVGAMCGVQLDVQGSFERVSVTIFGAGPAPVRCSDAERALLATADTAEAARLAAGAVDPVDDLHASGPYRKKVAEVLVKRALDEAVMEARNA